MTKAHIIMNSRAGGLIDGDAERTAAHMEQRLKAAGWTVTACIPEPEEFEVHLQDLDAELDVVVAAGGDGTLAGVGARLRGRRTALAIVPLGTMNVLATDLGIPADFDQALETAVTGTVTAVDAAAVDGHVFFIQTVLGVAADIAERREKLRGAGGVAEWAELAGGVTSDLLGSTPMRYVVRTGRRRTVITTRAMIISNNRLKDGKRLLPFRRTLRGQVLGLYALRGRSWLRTLLFAAEAVLPGANPHVREMMAKRIVLESDEEEVRALIDGEIADLRLPATFEILPRALNVIVPGRKP